MSHKSLSTVMTMHPSPSKLRMHKHNMTVTQLQKENPEKFTPMVSKNVNDPYFKKSRLSNAETLSMTHSRLVPVYKTRYENRVK